MASALMAWVWICVTLAQLNNAESYRYAHGHLAGQGDFSDGNEELLDAVPEDWIDPSFPATVWNFLQGTGKSPETSDFYRPQYRCSNGMLYLRFSLIRYTNLRLEGGARLLSLPDRCHSSIHIYRRWLLVKLSYTGCHRAKQTGAGTGVRPLKLHYFDRLLQENMTGMAVCENPVLSPQSASPLVTCRTTQVIVELPRETKLRNVKELDFSTDEGYSVRQKRTSSTLFVEISKLPDQDSGFELVYADSTGKLHTILAACSPPLPKVGRHHVRRSLDNPDLFDLWGFDDIPLEPFDPETQTTTTQTTTAQTTTTTQPTSSTTDADTTTTEENVSEEIFDLWGFEEIPEDPYTGIDVEITTTTTTTPTTTTPAAPTTTTTTTPATTTTAAPTTTTRAPSTATRVSMKTTAAPLS